MFEYYITLYSIVDRLGMSCYIIAEIYLTLFRHVKSF